MAQQSWGFDRPVLRDPLLWAGLLLGLALVLLSPPTVTARWFVVLAETVGRVGAGVVLAGVFGGAVRNLLRALEADPPTSAEEQPSASTPAGEDRGAP